MPNGDGIHRGSEPKEWVVLITYITDGEDNVSAHGPYTRAKADELAEEEIRQAHAMSVVVTQLVS